MMKNLTGLLFLLLPLTAIAAESASGIATADGSQANLPVIIKSPIDRKDYRALVLDNGLKVLLVSDSETDKSAASLDVHVGNGSDPAEWQGLAHFLEHMLFLGNRKYPEAGEYKKFIDDHGGSNNAYTSFDHTNYYFEIGADDLFPALDRFSRFFIDPTFDETFVNRERSIVHSEFQARRKDESRRLWTAQRQLVNPDHPWSQFAVGSEQTLRDREGVTVQQKLKEFYNRHYSADIMALAVVGKEPLDKLEQWARELFAEIPDRDAKDQSFSQPYINTERLSSRLNVVPEKDVLRVSFLFPIPSTESHYRTKPVSYIANLLGHEGEGSLLALLKSLGWADELSAGAGYMDKVQGTFNVTLRLTEPGMQHIEEIGSLLFQAINLVTDSGVESWRYDEEHKLAEISFRFAEERGSGSVARSLAARLHRYPSEDVLRGPYLMEDYQPALIAQVLSYLRPDNVILKVIAKDLVTTASTPFYGVEFGLQSIAQSTLDLWSKEGLDKRLALPEANQFIPERLVAQSQGHVPAIPEQLNVQEGIDAWYRSDPEFSTPRAGYYFSVKSPVAGISARNLVLTELFVRMVNRQLDIVSYPAYLADLNYELYRHSRGFSVRITGYEDKQPAMLKVVLKALLEPRFDSETLVLTKAELKREWNNIALESPSSQTVHEIYRLLMHPYWTESERLAVLDEIENDDLRDYADRLLENVSITILSHGDVTRQRSIEMSEMLKSAFDRSTLIAEVDRPVTRMLNDKATWLRTLDVDHSDSALAIYFQGHEKSDLERAKMTLLAQLMESPFFFNLRTTNQVGYLVYVTPLNILEVPGLLFSVQSPTYTPDQINELVNGFLEEFGQTIGQMDAGKFEQVKQGLITRILAQDKRLVDRTNRYWREIDLKRFEFDSRERLTGLIGNLDREDIQKYFHLITAEQSRILVVQSPGRREQAANRKIEGKPYITTHNATEFQKSAESFFPAY